MARTREAARAASLRIALIAAAIAAGATLTVHSWRQPPALGGDWPAGTLIVARTEALGRLLVQLQRLEGTPVARRAAAIAAELPDCGWVEGRSEREPGEIWAQLRCRSGSDEFAGLDRERGDRDLAFALPTSAGARVVGRLAFASGGDVAVEVLVPTSAFTSVLALLRPSAEGPGPALLSHEDALVHGRLRPEGGIDLAGLVPSGSQADQMFRLKSELFAGAVLDGTWEIAVYPPAPGGSMPHSALAIGTSLATPAAAAMEDFVREITTAWPVHRSAFAVGGAAGACLLDLNLMPELAPCYVATDAALVLGWNPTSVRHALAPQARAAPPNDDPLRGSLLRIDFERFAAADEQLARRAGPEAPPTGSRVYPWSRLSADGVPDGDAVRLRVRLSGGAGA